ncbi:Ribonuclease HII [hydrothermal vent metagenome]|uniref:Ribonuclease HII n=1 Tax=hydrothermal vent metagenome TaxID=652676 RepID=A0A1W1BHP5_9ZZZZ
MLCGIDEAGRGPIAGDLVVAGCILLEKIEGLGDSKSLSAKKREQLFEVITQKSNYHIVKHSAQQIDKLGLSVCIKNSLEEIMQTLKATRYLFDGNSTFGVSNLETMIKADAKVAEVSAASILAKVTRDRSMIEAAKIYPEYEFDKHKGYITKRHVELIQKYGYCDIHRKSYKVKALQSTLF